jgi:hypothetical protein
MTKNIIFISKRMIVVMSLLAVSVLLIYCSSHATAQSGVTGIHGMSQVQGVRITSVILTSENEVSFNLTYVGNASTTPQIKIFATALINGTEYQPGVPPAMAGSRILNSGWGSPKTVQVTLNGTSSLYDADVVTVLATPPEWPSSLAAAQLYR